MIDDMLGAVSQLLQEGAEYIMVQVIDKEQSGSSRDLRIIVDNKKEECEHGFASNHHKEHHPSATGS